MKTYIFYLSISVLVLSGCSTDHKYVELQQDTFAEMDVSQISSVSMVSVPFEKGPDKWQPVYTNVFPITDSKEIRTICDCIKKAKKVKRWNTEYDDTKLLFKTEELIYYLEIDWDTEFAAGDWWESEELGKHFEQWGIKN